MSTIIPLSKISINKQRSVNGITPATVVGYLRFQTSRLEESVTQMEPPMANITGLAKSTTDLRHRSWDVANHSDRIAIALFSAVALLALTYSSVHFPMSDQVAVLLSQAP